MPLWPNHYYSLQWGSWLPASSRRLSMAAVHSHWISLLLSVQACFPSSHTLLDTVPQVVYTRLLTEPEWACVQIQDLVTDAVWVWKNPSKKNIPVSPLLHPVTEAASGVRAAVCTFNVLHTHVSTLPSSGIITPPASPMEGVIYISESVSKTWYLAVQDTNDIKH